MKKFGISLKLRNYEKLEYDISKDSLNQAVKKLTNIKSLEIDYITQAGKNGVAISLFERLLDHPEALETQADHLVTVLQFWIDAVRKKLTRKLDCWWDFLKRILKFIETMSYKEASIPEKLLQLSQSLLDLACGILSPQQSIHVLHSLNMNSAVSSRKARLENKPSIADYFLKLGHRITITGHFPYQFFALECIVRWIVPRDTAALRAAATYFPSLSQSQRDAFVLAKWKDFLQDARKFLNAINKETGLVISIMCKKISAGDVEICASTERQTVWLDINTCDGTVSTVLEPRALQCLVGLRIYSCEALVLAPTAVTLRSGPEEVIISLKTTQPPRVLPSGCVIGTGCDVTVLVSSREELQPLHEALLEVFGEKYQRLIANNVPTYTPVPSPCESRRSEHSSDGFSTSTFIKPKCGEVVVARTRTSSVSTGSLAELRLRLTALPETFFEKEFSRITDQANSPLSHISEETSHARLPFGNCMERKAGSDIEGKTRSSHHQTVVSTVPSALLLGTDKSTISTDNIVDLLMKEAESNRKSSAKRNVTVVSKTTTEDEEYNTDVINETPSNITSRQSRSKKSLQAITKDPKHIENQQICNKAMADKFDSYEYVDIEAEVRETESLPIKEAKQREKEFEVKQSRKTTSNKKANLETGQTRPQRNKKPTYKACEAFGACTSNIRQPNKTNRACQIPESEQEESEQEYEQPSSPDNVNENEVEKPSVSDETPVVDQNAKRKRKLYSPKDDDNDINESSSSTVQRNTHYNTKVAQRQRCYPPEKEAAENVRSNEELLSPRTMQKDALFNKVKASSENNATEVAVGKNRNHDVYNFSSEESDDEDFSEKRMKIARRGSVSERKQANRTRKKAVKKPAANRRKKKANETTTKRRNPRRNSTSTVIEYPLEDIEDERMRATNTDNDNALDSSFVLTKRYKEPAQVHFSAQIQSEIIGDDNVKAKKINKTIISQQQNEPNHIATRRSSRLMSVSKPPSPVPSDDSGSPLPGLIVENTTSKRNNFSSLEDLGNIYEDNRSNVYEEEPILLFEDFVRQDMRHGPIENLQRNKPEPKSGSSEYKGKPSTKAAEISKDNKRRVEEELESEESQTELDNMAVEDVGNVCVSAPKDIVIEPTEERNNVEHRSSTSKQIEVTKDNFDEDIRSTRKRKASVTLQSIKAPRLNEETDEDFRVSSTRHTQTGEQNAMEEHTQNDNHHQVSHQPWTDTELKKFDVLKRNLDRWSQKVTWKASHARSNLSHLQRVHKEDFPPDILSIIHKLKDDWARKSQAPEVSTEQLFDDLQQLAERMNRDVDLEITSILDCLNKLLDEKKETHNEVMRLISELEDVPSCTRRKPQT